MMPPVVTPTSALAATGRENLAAALRYLENQRENVRQYLERAASLDPQEQDLTEIAVETGASMLPLVGQTVIGPALALRDLERGRRANDPALMAMAGVSAIPGGRLAKLLKGFDPTRLELDVYHGTPHRYAPTEANPLGEFDASKIGTGEGAQAYGHGVYLAESPGVAKSYQTAGDFGVMVDGKSLASRKKYQKLSDESRANVDLILRDIANGAVTKNQLFGYAASIGGDYATAYRLVRDAKNIQYAKGSLYKADLPDEMIDRMLDWDKPLSEQHPEVQRIIGEEIKRIGRSAHTGEQAYRQLMFEARMQGKKSGSNVMKNNLEANEASKRLQELGIPGIKYADAGSRGKSGGTRNFVVFPGEEKKVRILERK